MKPAVSLIPEPDRSTEERKAIPRAWKDVALARSGGTCARLGCEVRDGLEFDHVLALGLGGAHAAENIEPLCGPHHLAKTKRDVRMIARAKRLARETCTAEPKRKLTGRGFGSVSRGFDGTVKLTKRAQREAKANDDAPEGEGRAAC